MKFINKDGLFHWLTQRISAVLMIFLLIIFFNNIFYFSLFLIILCYHVFVGIETFFDDYIHNINFFSFCVLFLRILFLFLVKMILVLSL